MFKFAPAERCLYGGVSPTVIGDSIRNEFLMVFGAPEINYRVSVVLNERNIQFFYYDGEAIDSHTTRNMDKLKEMGSISLTYPKETGNDILKFPKIGTDGMPEKLDFFKSTNQEEKQEGKPEDKNKSGILPILSSFQEQFYNFPFLKKYDKSLNKENKIDEKENFCNFIKCCLLAFVFEFEDREEVFANSPLYDKVRDSLRKSDVYKLLSAKIQYTLYVTEKGVNYNRDEYTYRTQRFADRLMDHRINKVIAPYNYSHKSRKNEEENTCYCQTWFDDPEDELEDILERNRKQEYDNQQPLEDSLVLKIRDFLYTKHAVKEAMTKIISKRLFYCAQILMFISSLAILCSSLCTQVSDVIMHEAFPALVILYCVGLSAYFGIKDYKDKNKAGHHGKITQPCILVPFLLLLASSILLLLNSESPSYPLQIVFYISVCISVLVWIWLSGSYNNPNRNNKTNGVIYAFYPRILVAELAAWLTLGITEDLVKSMLWINGVIIPIFTLFFVLFFLTILLLGEAKQHSPYKKIWTNFKKVLLILNHSLFFALCIGIIMQISFYDNLIKNSDVIPTIVYDDYIGDANYYCQNLENLKESMEQLEMLTITHSIVGGVDMKGNNRGNAVIIHPQKKDTLGIFFSRNSMSLKNESSLKSEDYNQYVKLVNSTIQEIVKLKETITYKDFPFFGVKSDSGGVLKKDSVLCCCSLDTLTDTNEDHNKKINENHNKEIIAHNKEIIATVNRNKVNLLKLNEEIANVKRSIASYCNYDTLMSWSKIEEKKVSVSGSTYLDTLTSKAKEDHQCWKEVKLPILGPQKVFPTLLLFHTLIVLVLAFVTQLIISDKSVTEPL